MSDPDFLDEMIAERTEQNPGFPELVEAAIRRRALLRGAHREALIGGPLPTAVQRGWAHRNPRWPSFESAEVDAKLSTIERYAAAVGQRVEFHLTEDHPRIHHAG